MPAHVIMTLFTDQGDRAAEVVVRRAQVGRERIEAAGGPIPTPLRLSLQSKIREDHRPNRIQHRMRRVQRLRSLIPDPRSLFPDPESRAS